MHLMQSVLLTSLRLQDFRNFETKEFIFDSLSTLILGNNGKGKTNILEAISLLSTGRSFRAKLLSDCVRYGAEVGHIEGNFHEGEEKIVLGASIISGASELSKRASTRFKKNGVAKRKTEVVGVLKSVLFRPEDLEIVTDGPSFKRDFLDDVLVQVSKSYNQSLREYERALKHRNKLILQLREGLATRKDFVFWDTLLIKHGDELTRARARFVHFINTYVQFPIKGEVVYDLSLMSEDRLHAYAVQEVAAGKTLVGPHRDSLVISLDLGEGQFLDVGRFGSRGQQRMAVLWLKVASLKFIEQETNDVPMLLLDDIFSELDETNRELVLNLFENRQVILTSAEEKSVLPKQIEMEKLIQL